MDRKTLASDMGWLKQCHDSGMLCGRLMMSELMRSTFIHYTHRFVLGGEGEMMSNLNDEHHAHHEKTPFGTVLLHCRILYDI